MEGFSGSEQNYPSLLAKELPVGEVEVFLVCEQQVITKVTGIEAPMALLAAYYSYNMSYPKGTNSFFTFLEIKLCDLKIDRIPVVVSNLVIGVH